VAKNPDPSLKLTTRKGVTRTLDDWATMFHLALIVLPARSEASHFVPIARRVFSVFGDADCTTAFVVTGPAAVADRLLGPIEEEDVAFLDPDLELVSSLGLERLPAFVHLRQDTTLVDAAEGWQPAEWKRVAQELAKSMAWNMPEVTGPGDPRPFVGWPVG
jgi:hypothetical protein